MPAILSAVYIGTQQVEIMSVLSIEAVTFISVSIQFNNSLAIAAFVA